MPEKKDKTKIAIQATETTTTPKIIETPKRNFDNISYYILVFVAFLMPFFFLPASILGIVQTKATIFALGTICSLVFYIAERLRQGSIRLSLSVLTLSSVLVIISAFVSSFLSINQFRSFVGYVAEQDTFQNILIGFVFVFLVARLSGSLKKISIMLGSLYLGVFISIIIKMVSLVFGSKLTLGVLLTPSDTLAGTWGDLTILSVLLMGALVVVLEVIPIRKWVHVILSAFLVIPFIIVSISGIFFDFYLFGASLSSLIFVVTILLFAYIFSLRRVPADGSSNDMFKLRTKLSPSLLLLTLSVVFVVFGSPIGAFFSRVSGITYIEGRPNWQATSHIASKVLEQRPFFGSGPNTFSSEWNLHKTANINNYPFWNDDFDFGVGIIPTFAVTMGIWGLLVWVLFYGAVAKIAIKSLFKFEGDNEFGFILRMVVSLSVLGTTFLLFFYSPGFVVGFVNLMFIGLLLALQNDRAKSKDVVFNKTQLINFVSTLVLSVVVVGMVYWVYILVKRDVAQYSYRRSVMGNNINISINHINRAIEIDNLNPIYRLTAAQMYVVKITEILKLPRNEVDNRKAEINNLINESISMLVSAEALDPNNFQLKLASAKLLEFYSSIGLPDADKAAVLKYLSSQGLSPSNPLPDLFIANLLIGTGDKLGAKDHLTKAILLKSNYADVPLIAEQIQTMITKISKATQAQTSSTTDKSSKAKTTTSKN